MSDRSITTSTGTTITLTDCDDMTLVLLDAPDAPADMRNLEAGRLVDGGFQPAPFAAWGLVPATLRAIADLIEAESRA